jgi:bacillopeptidase F (M6 metalloprotease family)
VTIVADEVTTQDVTLTQLPSGTVAGFVTDSQSGLGIAASVTVLLGGEAVVWTSTNPATGEYSVVLPIGTYDLVFNPEFPYPMVRRNDIAVIADLTTTLDVALMAAQILLVDDDVGDAYESYYELAIAAAGRTYLTVTTPPAAADMALFESVVWFTGDDYTSTLTAQDQAEIATYLDGGGRLFISGQDIGYDINTSAFYGDYLHAAYVQDDVALGGVLGNPANPVGFGFMFDIKGGDGANNQTYPSEVDPIAPAMTAFIYDESVPEAVAAAYGASRAKAPVGDVGSQAITSTGTAGLTFDDGAYKLVYFAFGFEAIATVGDRSLLMDRILDWLQGYPEIVHTPLGDTEDTENAYHVRATITSDFFALDPSTFVVVYDVGGPEMTLPMSPMAVPEDYEAFIPPQPTDTQVNYYIAASDVEGHTSTDPVGAPVYKHSFMVAKDVVPPIVEHMRLFDTNDLDGPYCVSAMVADNIGVGSVYLMYAKNGGMHYRMKMMLQPDGSYMGCIPGPSEVGDVYEYHIYAMDGSYSGNVIRVPAVGAYDFEIVEEFVWDFEDYDGGFVPTGDVWEWGAPTTGPGAAHSGVNVWATRLGGDYPSSSDATLDIPPITLSAGKPYAILTFWHWYYIETNWDGGNVKVSTDGGATWDIVTPLGGYDGIASSANAGIPGEPCFTGYNNDFWQEELFDLSAYAGQQVMIRFHFGSDGSVQRSGWYIDDVRLRSTDVDDIPPVISNTQVPGSTFDTVGPYEVSTFVVVDPLSGLASVSTFYSTDDGATFTELAMSPGADPDEWVASIPGQPNGTRVKLYIHATDIASPSNESTDPAGAPGDTYGFAVLPSAPILVLQMTSSASSLDMFREALEANGHEADYWYRPDGWLDASKLGLYKTIVLDETGSLTTEERTDLATFLESGTPNARKEIMVMGRDLGYYSSTRPWIEEYMKAAYVQDNPGWRELTGEPGEPIGADETFVISGSYPDETQRSTNYPGGEIVYRYTAPGTAMETRGEVEGAYEKDAKEWDGVMPHAPKSLDAGAGIKYAGAQYRSLYFTFNFYYIQEDWRRAGIIDRALAWLSAPQIVHEPLHDTEDTVSPYPVVAQVYSETLDPTRVELTYDPSTGPVTVVMAPTGNPDEFAADIPAQPLGTTVEYYLSASNLDGTTSHHPQGAPTDKHVFQVNADIIPPEIVHTPYANTADQTGPYTIEAMVTDNVGVDPNEVDLVYNKNGGADATVAMSSLGGDMYAADIPGPAVLGDVYNYYITASDIATVPNTAREPGAGYHSFEIVDYYAWDFEADDGGFAATGPDWEWGEPTTGPGAAHSGVNVWATKVGGDYSSSSDSRLHTISLRVPSTYPYATLSFWQWYYIETNYDGGNVKISTDGGSSWTILTPDIGYNGTATSGNAAIPGEPCFTGYNDDIWHKVTFDLTPYSGQEVIIRLHFGSDSSVQRVGWYVDDMRIESFEGTEGPAFVSTSVPASTYDEVGPYTVTSVVQDVLSGVASATLYYSTDDGSSWTSAAMSPTGNPDEYSADIPGQSSGTRIKLYVEATDNEANTTTDPAGAPASAYEFGIMPSGDYLVLLGGTSHTSPVTFQTAFSAIGRTADIWDWDDLGVPTVDILLAYQAVVVDESFYLDTAQRDLLGTFLDTSSGSLNKIFIMGRDLSWGSSAQPWMEQYTGSAYVQDDPGWRELTSAPGDPIGADETFTIQGSYPDELKLSTTYPGGQVVYTYSGTGTSLDRFDTEQDAREFYEKQGKAWDSKYWPFAPIGPDDAAAIRYVSATHASVYFALNFNYIQESDRQAAILDRALDWLGTATTFTSAMAEPRKETPNVPNKLTLGRNFPNPFNPVTRIEIGVPNAAQRVSLKVYNVHGQLVKTVFDGTKSPGFHVLE